MSDKKKILVVQNIHEAGIKLLKENSNYEYEIIENIDLEILKKKIVDCHGLSIRTAKLPGEIIDLGKKLKIISRHGVGYDNIDLETSKKNNLTLAITATANAVAVAEHVMYMMLSLSKGVTSYDNVVRSGSFKKNVGKIQTYELFNKEILIVGFGRIGKNLIKRCLGFDMKVNVFDPFVGNDIIKSYGGTKIEKLNSGIITSDFVSIHMPLNKETKNLFNMEMLKKMKKSSILINTARGGIINEKDLDIALKKNIIFAAGLDVFEKEPPDLSNALLKNNKVLLSPHSATFTKECKSRMSIETVQNIIDFFENKINDSMIVKL